MIRFLEKSRAATLGLVTEFLASVCRDFPGGIGWEAERKETALVCENKSVRSDRLDERTGLEKREEALICGNNCYIIHLQ